MPTRTQQSDLLSCAYASNGDTKHVLLFPEDPKECFDFTADALDLADRLQTPVFVMTDLDIGMNHRLCQPLRVGRQARLRPRQGDDRRPSSTPARTSAAISTSTATASRSAPIPARIRPRARIFTRGTTKDEYARYSEEGPVYVAQHGAAAEEVRHRAKIAPQPLRYSSPKPTRYGVIYFGSTSPAMAEALDHLEADGNHVNALRVRAFPFAQAVEDFIHEHDKRVRRRAEPRRPAAHHADERVHARRAQARAGPAL